MDSSNGYAIGTPEWLAARQLSRTRVSLCVHVPIMLFAAGFGLILAASVMVGSCSQAATRRALHMGVFLCMLGGLLFLHSACNSDL